MSMPLGLASIRVADEWEHGKRGLAIFATLGLAVQRKELLGDLPWNIPSFFGLHKDPGYVDVLSVGPSLKRLG